MDESELEESEDHPHISPIFIQNQDPEEAALEAKELSKYLLAKSLFDCREYDRCAAVFLPDSLFAAVLTSQPESTPVGKGKSKAKAAETGKASSGVELPQVSQKSLFLALYAKFLSGEKRKCEDSEMVMGPQDLGTVANKQLLPVGRYLSAWFDERTVEGEVVGSQGWLEYLYVSCRRSIVGYPLIVLRYGIVLAKEKNDKRALAYLIQSVHKYPMNWGCWLEMTSLISGVEDVRCSSI